MNRRTFLSTAATAASVSLAGCPDEVITSKPTARSPPPRRDVPYREQYGSVVDLAAAGADVNGSEPIDRVLRRAVDDDTLVFVPPGRYRLAELWELSAFENLGLVGDGATIVPPKGYDDYLFALGRPGVASGLRFEGFTFDFRHRGTGARAIQARVDDGLVVRDVTVRGRQDSDAGVTRFDVTGRDGRGTVTRLDIPDGGKPGTVSTGCLVGPTSTGHITFEDCHIAGFPDNGLYASPAAGRVTVRGGTYANSGVANVRVSGPSLVEGVTVRCDRSVPGISNMRGIRVRGGAGTVVRNCTLELEAVNGSDGAISLSATTGPVRVEDTEVRIDADRVPALRAKPPTAYEGRERPAVECRGLSVTGTAARGSAIRLTGRPGSTLEGLCVHQTGRARDGVLLERSGSTRVAGAVSVTGRRLVVENSVHVVRSLSAVDGGC